ncbi:MAG: hypothetical protein MUC82_02010 [Cypionkella sp.]|nr:hypothetical protein [Cypionkella sp.]
MSGATGQNAQPGQSSPPGTAAVATNPKASTTNSAICPASRSNTTA